MNILFVDDDDSLRWVIENYLGKIGHSVSTADGGDEAKSILENQGFDLIITDLYMKKGGGQQLIDWCLKNKAQTKILAISGEELDNTLSALDIAAEKGISTLEKPFELPQLEQIINGMMANQFH